MRFALTSVLVVSGCFIEPDVVDADLDAFGDAMIGIGKDGHSFAVELPAKNYRSEGPCPILRDVTATFAGVPLQVLARGGYDAFFNECEVAYFKLDGELPAVVGATVELETPDSRLSCSIDDVHLDAGLELVEGGSWTQVQGTPRIGVAFSRPNVSPTQLTAMAVPVAGGTSRDLEPLLVNGVIMLHLSFLEPGDYTIRVERPINLNAPHGRCWVTSGAFATALLTIRAP